MRLIEGTHYRRRENHSSAAPHKSKEAIKCFLCSDSGDDDGNEYIATKRSRPIRQNLRLDRFHAHLKSHNLDACCEGARRLLTMGFSRRAPSVAAIAPEGVMIKKGWYMPACRMRHHLRGLILISEILQAWRLPLQLRVKPLLLRHLEAWGMLRHGG